jgi:glutathionyl-hydroquinone reductase
MKSLLTEYCEELLNTDAFKKDAKAAYEAVYKEWVKAYANDKGQFTLYRAKGCDKWQHRLQGPRRPARTAGRLRRSRS